MQAISPPVAPLPKPHERKLGHGHEHGMKAIEFPNPSDIKTFSDLAEAMGQTTAGGRDLSKAVEVAKAMVADKDCFVVLTLSGNCTPLTVLISELIDRGIVNVVVSTGAIMTHSFSVERGRPMFQVDDPEAIDDNWFYAKGYNRIYDCVELEESLNEGFDILREITDSLDPDTLVTSADITQLIGAYLNEHFPKERGILHSAEKAGVPVFVPAFSDSELGLDFFAQNLIREKEGGSALMFDSFGDWQRYADLIKEHRDSCGIITLGGGTPRNWSQQVGPSFDILTEYGVEPKSLIMRFKYAVRICSAPGTEAGLSSCSYSEGRSWGKLWPSKNEGAHKNDIVGMNAEVVGDFTLAFPLLAACLIEEDERGKSK
jgi:deoxyhypusine synthase